MDIVINQSVEKVIELCDISKCSEKMWLYVIAPFASFTVIVFTVITVMCCRKYRKNDQRDGIANIQNVRVALPLLVARRKTKFKMNYAISDQSSDGWEEYLRKFTFEFAH